MFIFRILSVYITTVCLFGLVAVWLSGNVLVSINVVALRRAWLVLGWVTVCGYTILAFTETTRPTQPGHPSVGRRNEY